MICHSCQDYVLLAGTHAWTCGTAVSPLGILLLQTQIEQSTKRNYAWQVAVVAGVAGAVLVTFQGCGHLALFQEVDSFVALVDSFLAAQGSFQPQPASAYTCHGLGLSGSAP